ncbi:hypothetical protein [Apibacter adventoris]|uniref:Core-binding (CB) domain-containing protein n=1 Tax=Apibacter adventoris TaxID=1679466 RepID=A0A2S8AEK5_9FLAO|nr:hypothetical protein [Apibacter adventoris]PQL93784.1 hypothetical protein C4S77_04330 [Apibacter adventoris]
MNNFISYLRIKYKYAERTLQAKENHIENWEKLCLKDQELEKLTTKALLSLIENQKKKYQISTLNNQLKTLEQYYNYLVAIKKRKSHPLINFRIKSETKPLIQGLLTEQELTELYENYSVQGHLGGQFNHYRQRNKVILGLMIYQGLDSITLERLEIGHIDVEKAIVQVPRISEYKLKERILPLASNQIMELHKYLTQTREELLKIIKTEQETKKLFPKSSKTRFSSITQSIKKQIEIENIHLLCGQR